jgi:hypothetical protein
MMMKMSKQLEKQIGHKPTYEELVDYVDNKAFHFPDDNEISQEVKAMVEAARQEVRQRLKK